jgi:hypothetical protein
MRKRPASQTDLSDTFLTLVPTSQFPEQLEAFVGWQTRERELAAMFTA